MTSYITLPEIESYIDPATLTHNDHFIFLNNLGKLSFGSYANILHINQNMRMYGNSGGQQSNKYISKLFVDQDFVFNSITMWFT